MGSRVYGLQWLWLTGSRAQASVVVTHGLSCSTACGIFPDQGWNRCPCTGRWILNHCATREVPVLFYCVTLVSHELNGDQEAGGNSESV